MVHHVAPEAASDLDEIWYYIARNSGRTDLADKFVDAVTQRFHLLALHPHMGRTRGDLRPGLRSFPVGDYIILYRAARKDVLILRVLQGRRDIIGLEQRDH